MISPSSACTQATADLALRLEFVAVKSNDRITAEANHFNPVRSMIAVSQMIYIWFR